MFREVPIGPWWVRYRFAFALLALSVLLEAIAFRWAFRALDQTVPAVTGARGLAAIGALAGVVALLVARACVEDARWHPRWTAGYAAVGFGGGFAYSIVLPLEFTSRGILDPGPLYGYVMLHVYAWTPILLLSVVAAGVVHARHEEVGRALVAGPLVLSASFHLTLIATLLLFTRALAAAALSA